MRTIKVNRNIKASKSAVWAVLADYPNISQWNAGVKNSFSTSEATEGVGARRHCDLSPAGALEEIITLWEPEDKLGIEIESVAKLPVKRADVLFNLEGDEDQTAIEVSYAYETKFGPVGKLLGPILDPQLRKGFSAFLKDLDAASQK